MIYDWKNMSEEERIIRKIHNSYESIKENFNSLMNNLIILHKVNESSCIFEINNNIKFLLFEEMLDDYIYEFFKVNGIENAQNLIDVLRPINQNVIHSEGIDDLIKKIEEIKERKLNTDKI